MDSGILSFLTLEIHMTNKTNKNCPAEQAIVAEIAMTNNGKLLKSRMPNALYADMVRMLDEGKLVNANFLEVGDAVRLA